MLTVHLRIVDESTSKPTPARLRISGPGNVTFVPLGRVADFAVGPDEDVGGHLLLGGERFVYVNGTAEVPLPAGVPLRVQITKGHEYEAIDRVVTLGPGQIALRFTLRRLVKLEGWSAGDSRCHALSSAAGALEGAAEGLRAVQLLARERPRQGARPRALMGLLDFTGVHPIDDASEAQVAVNTLNVHPLLGTLGLLDCHRPVYPLRFGDAYSSDDWSVLDWCQQCHRKRGLVTWVDSPRLTLDCPQGEALAAAILGQVDAWEITDFRDPEQTSLTDWYDLLGCGLKLPLVGASGKDSNAVAIGRMRTYVKGDDAELSALGRWIKGIKRGMSFVTNGPLLSFTIDGQAPEHIFTDAESPLLRVNTELLANARSGLVQLICNGAVVAETDGSMDLGYRPSEPCWLAVRFVGLDRHADGQLAFAHSSPWYWHPTVRPRPAVRAAERMLQVLKLTEEWSRTAARYEQPRFGVQLRETLAAARRVLLSE